MARMRSPNFPTVPLKQSIDLIELIYKADRDNAIDKEVAALHMGYSGLTGRTLKLMGAMSQFGLLDKVGKGQVRVSKTAISILRPMNDEERQTAITMAGRSPGLFRKIDSAFNEPSDKTLEAYLVREGFTDSAVPAVIKAYRDTNSFIAREGSTEIYEPDDEEGSETFSDDESQDEVEEPSRREAKETIEREVERDVDLELRFNFDGQSINVSGRTTSPAALRMFIERLQAMSDVFEKLVPEKTHDLSQGTEG